MKDFESRLAKLESLAEKMKDSTIPLETAVKVFEEGIALSRELKQELDSIQRRVELVLGDPDETDALRTQPLDESQES